VLSVDDRRAPADRPPAAPPRQRTGGRHVWWRLTATAVAVAAASAGIYVATRAVTSGPAGHSAPPSARGSARPAPRSLPPARLPVGSIGGYAVAGLSFALSRRTASGPRELNTWVRYPVIPAGASGGRRLARGLFPLMVFAPGYRQCQGSYSSLLNTWASAGYVVAAVEFPRTNCDVTDPDEDDLSNQPADVQSVISQLLAISAEPTGALSGMVNPSQVAVAGHSDGGDTVAALAANTCCTDRQVTAAIILAGAEWPPLGGTYFPKPSPPVLFVQGSADTWNPPAASQQLYQADTTGPRYYLDLPGADHFAPYEGSGPPEPVVAQVTVDFLDRYVAGQPQAGPAMLQAGQAPGHAVLVGGGQPPP
jgi:predicted dienelactone hydrolase